jgi:hypothetical protein
MWELFNDVEAPGRIVETFMVESWIEHLRRKRPAAPPIFSLEAHAISVSFRRNSRWRSGMGKNSGDSILKPGVAVI